MIPLERSPLEEGIARALVRGNSPFVPDEVWRWFARGELHVAISEGMNSSWRYLELEDGRRVAEIVHVAGNWSESEARYLLGCMFRDMAERGVDQWKWSGRRGWARFLKRKGFKP